jgi:hypothetical protein
MHVRATTLTVEFRNAGWEIIGLQSKYLRDSNERYFWQ